MRYLSLIFIVLAMWWSWSAIHAPAVISEAEHARVQSELKQVIRSYITSHLPTAKNIRFNSFWTRTLNANSMRASFSYTFDDTDANNEATRIGIDGYALLDKKANSQQASLDDVWSLDKLEVTNDRYNFLNGVLVKPGAASSAGTATPAPAANGKK